MIYPLPYLIDLKLYLDTTYIIPCVNLGKQEGIKYNYDKSHVGETVIKK